MSVLTNDWNEVLGDEFTKPYYLELREFIKQEYNGKTIYPTMSHIFHALHTTSYQNTKVVILGQDPYHGPGQAHGLSFSVKPGVRVPPSLKNIYKELHQDLGHPIPSHGCLQHWADQGVLLLNTVLTVQEGHANSHRGKGWEIFTDQVMKALNRKVEPVVFILWGKHAQQKAQLISNPDHVIIESPHPSPLSARRGFFGSRPFSRTNQYLKKNGLEEIDWDIPELVDK